MLEGCSEACPAHVALRAVVIRQNNCSTTELSWLRFYHAVPLLLGRQKTSLFLSQRHCKSRTERSDITCTTSQANEQPKDLMACVTSLKSWIIIQSGLNPLPYHLPRWIECNAHSMRIGFQVGFMWMLKPDWMHIQCASWCPCERPFSATVDWGGIHKLL